MDAELPLLDNEVQLALRELMQGDYELLIDTFIADTQMRLTHLELHLRTQDWQAFGQTAHSFRGSCGNMGALGMQRCCEQAEAAALTADAPAAQAALAGLQTQFAQVRLLLRP